MFERYHRQEMFFGTSGQERIERTRVAIIGIGGLGSHVAQQLAYLGVGSFSIVDKDIVTTSSLNRLVGASESDVGEPKARVAAKMIERMRGNALVNCVLNDFISLEGYMALRAADFVFGCVDNDASRFVLNECSQAYERPYFDLASDVYPDEGSFGGRILFANGQICIICKDVVDQRVLRVATSTEQQREEDEKLYGVRRDALGQVGPSVVSLNGVIASLAVTEFMVEVTGMRAANPYLEYRAEQGVVFRSSELTGSDCHYCRVVRGQGERADTERFIRQGWGQLPQNHRDRS